MNLTDLVSLIKIYRIKYLAINISFYPSIIYYYSVIFRLKNSPSI
mgnify:CR=1 FL=1